MFDIGFLKDRPLLFKLALLKASSGGSLPWTTFTGNPLQFTAPKAHALRSLIQQGVVEVSGSDITCNNGVLSAGSITQNIFDGSTAEALTLVASATRYGHAFTEAGTYCINAFGTPLATDYLYARILNSDETAGSVMYVVSGGTISSYKVTIESGQTLNVYDAVNNHVATDAVEQFGRCLVQVAMTDTQPTSYEPYVLGIKTTGTAEEITLTDADSNTQTATAPNLYAVEDITDEVDIITGKVTHRTQAVISDGTTPSGRYVGTVGEGNVIVEALEEKKIERITPQPLTTSEGTNTISATAEVDVTLTATARATEVGGMI